MAAKGTSYAGTLLALIFNGTTQAALAATAGTATNLYVSLHTASPGVGGNQSTSELTYSGYARVAVTRAATGWNVTSNTGTVSLVGVATFPQCTTADTNTVSYFGVGMSQTGSAGTLLYYGAVTPTIALGSNVTPELSAGSYIVES